MRDGDIREALLRHLRSTFTGDRIRSEMGLALGATRVDIAVINGALHGYEIKSEHDRLTRLPRQVDLYNQVLDYSTIVIGPRHEDKVRKLVPEWWGITLVDSPDSGPRIMPVRPPRRNRHISPLTVAQLLWRDEAADTLKSFGHSVAAKETRWDLWDRLAGLPLATLQDAVRLKLTARNPWPGG
jgi:hypothetical protein